MSEMSFKEKYEAGFYRGTGADDDLEWRRKKDKQKREKDAQGWWRAEFMRVLRIHFGQGVFDCQYCIDRKAGYCDGAGYRTYQQVAECVNKKHFGGRVKLC